MEKTIVKYLHERRDYPSVVADGVDSPCMKKERDMLKPWKTQKYHFAKSRSEDVNEDSRWKDECEMGEE